MFRDSILDRIRALEESNEYRVKREHLFIKFLKETQVFNERVVKERDALASWVAQLEKDREVDRALIESQRIWIKNL